MAALPQPSLPPRGEPGPPPQHRQRSPAGVEAALWLPRRALAACHVGIVACRSTGARLAPEHCFNAYPATPFACIGWLVQGEGRVPPPGQPLALLAAQARTRPGVIGPPMPRVTVSGPQPQPRCTWTAAPAHGLMLMLTTDALQRLTGLELSPLVGRILDADDWLRGPEWAALHAAVFAADDDGQRVRLIEDFLEPRWQAVRPAQGPVSRRVHDWAEALALRAANSATGRSLRQVERRIKGWAGLPLRELRQLARAESAFFATRQAQADGRLRWAEVAADTGYADQAHLCREVKRVTGLSPGELLQAIDQDERFWMYRLWGLGG